MDLRRQIERILIIMFTHLNIAKSGEFFKHDTKSQNFIREQILNLDCIHVNLLDMNEFLFQFLFNLSIPMIISNGLKAAVENRKQVQTNLCPNLVVQLQTIDNLAPIFDTYVNHRGVALILFSQKIDWHDVYLHSSYYWRKYKIYSVFYITAEHTRFYHPFVTRNEANGAMVDATDYNIKDIFKNLHGYPMRVYIFDSVFSKVKAQPDTFNVAEVKGVDAQVANLLEKKLNFNMQLQWPNENFFGARLENGSFNGALGRLIRNETDITMTGFFVKDYFTRDVHFSVSVYMDKLCCYVIKSKRIPESILPLYAVDENVWIVYLLVGLLLSFVWMLIRRTNLCIERYANEQESLKVSCSSAALYIQYLSIFTDTWVLWARMIIVRFPPYNSERIFAISLCLVSVIVGAFFDSSLATVYIRPRYYKDINTLAELEKANIKIFIKHAAMRDDLFSGQNSRLYNSLNERIMLVGEPEERLIKIMSKRGKFAAVTREFSLLTVDIYYFITKKIHIIPECPKTYHIAYLFTKSSPYKEAFDVALLQFLAAGLIDHWIEDSRHKAQCQIHKFEDFIAESSCHWKPFHINDLQLAFYILLLGNIFASLILFAEFVCKNLLFKKNEYLSTR